MDKKASPRCEGRLVVRAVISDLSVARQILDPLAKHARAPPRHEEDAYDAVLVLDQDYAWQLRRMLHALRAGVCLFRRKFAGVSRNDPNTTPLFPFSRAPHTSPCVSNRATLSFAPPSQCHPIRRCACITSIDISALTSGKGIRTTKRRPLSSEMCVQNSQIRMDLSRSARCGTFRAWLFSQAQPCSPLKTARLLGSRERSEPARFFAFSSRPCLISDGEFRATSRLKSPLAMSESRKLECVISESMRVTFLGQAPPEPKTDS